MVTVDGAGSQWTNSSSLYVGHSGSSVLTITNGGAVSNSSDSYIGYWYGSVGAVIVDGPGSTWDAGETLLVGNYGSATLNITGAGLVNVAGTLIIDKYEENGDGFVNMSTGGMLALNGEADGSLIEFLGLIDGTDAIRYWDGTGWDNITNATYGDDYTLEYLTTGDLTGYTMLTVTAAPEPATLLLLTLGGLVLIRRK